MSHTPGPWECSSSTDGTIRRKTNGEPLALFRVAPLKDDARLIAAAPELLEALQSIADCCDEEHGARDYASRQTEIRGIARAAIAKATGEPK